MALLRLVLVGLPSVIGGQAPNLSAAESGDLAPPAEARHAVAIQAILAEDAELGAIRNHASETTSLANGIRAYVDALDRLDFRACPPDFTEAFRRHRDAWATSIGFFSQFDELRGELHEIWAVIDQGEPGQQARFRSLSQSIVDTWNEVEQAARRYDALPS